MYSERSQTPGMVNECYWRCYDNNRIVSGLPTADARPALAQHIFSTEPNSNSL
jgi:hypothetical protein